jgi:hypothetical protein
MFLRACETDVHKWLGRSGTCPAYEYKDLSYIHLFIDVHKLSYVCQFLN